MNYNPAEIEKKWQKEWEDKKLYATHEGGDKPKFYVLDMFPYPSGEGLHVGHPKGYIATDVVSRMKRMQGFNVLHPMGFDAFGLPAEQYALKMKTNPAISVAQNVARYKKQLEILGFDYDWSREINTTDPKYYKWTQWIFLKLLEKGLAEERYEAINWCPVDKTGLSNEDIEDGKCERCGAVIEKRLMKQWVLKITKYADRLLEDLDAKDEKGNLLLDWPESIKESQRNWIGRSEGAEIDFKLNNNNNVRHCKVFTTRPDTLFGVTYVVLAPEHELVKELLTSVSNKEEVEVYIQTTKTKSEIDRTDVTKEKTGVELKGVKAINPANGEEVPVWIADYVLADYGTGAVMAVPAHDERDLMFARKFQLPVKDVIIPSVVDHVNPPREDKPSKVRKNVHAIVYNSVTKKYLIIRNKKFGWDSVIIGGVEEGEDLIEAAKREIEEETGYVDLEFKRALGGQVKASYFAKHKDENRIAFASAVYFELKSNKQKPRGDQEDKDDEILWVDAADMVPGKMVNSELPYWLERMKSKDAVAYTGYGTLINSGQFDDSTSEEAKKKITEFVKGTWVTKYKLREWVFSRQRYWGEPIPVYHDGDAIIPASEKELPIELPAVEFYEPTDTGESPLANISDWVNVEKDGKPMKRETNTMPQWAGSSWYYLRYMDPHNNNALVDPEKEKYWNEVDLYVGGAEHATRHLIYARFWHKFLFDIGVVSTIEPFKKLQAVGLIMADDGRKMSKRWGNVVNPDEMVETFGADAMRLYEMFMGPFNQAINWNTNGLVGTRRFVEKVWRLREKVGEKETSGLAHKTIKKVTEDIGEMRFNTAISQMMILVNEWEKEEVINKLDFESLLKLLAPFAPHVTEELWAQLGHTSSIHIEGWPEPDFTKMVDEEVKLVVQINGKVREIAVFPKDATEDEVKTSVMALPGVIKWIGGKEIKKVIFIQNKIINLLVDL